MTEETLEIPPEVMPPAPLPGKILARARQEKGLSVADVAHSLRLSVRQIEAIDADDFDKLPGKTFLRGFIRNYAKLLQIDPEPLLQGHLAATPQQKLQTQPVSTRSERVEYSSPRGKRTFSTNPGRPWLKYLLMALVVSMLAGWMAYELLRGGGGGRTVVVKPAAEPLVEPSGDKAPVLFATPPIQPQGQATPQPLALPPPPVAVPPASKAEAQPAPPSPSTGGKLKFSFTGESWIDIKDKNGRSIYKQIGYAGDEQTISGSPPLFLTVGKAANVKVQYNDKPVDLAPHTSGDVARLNLK